MSEFKREERYIVVKLKHLAGLQIAPLRNFLRENRVPTLDCVVVESDWPEYEKVWQSIERRMTGQPAVTAAEELEAVLHWRGKHTQAIRERDALQRELEQQKRYVEINANSAHGKHMEGLRYRDERDALRDEVGQVKGEYDRAVNKVHALQQRLTAADERTDVLEGLLLQTNELLYAIQGDPGAVPSSSIDSMRGRVFEALKRDRSTSVLLPQNL